MYGLVHKFLYYIIQKNRAMYNRICTKSSQNLKKQTKTALRGVRRAVKSHILLKPYQLCEVNRDGGDADVKPAVTTITILQTIISYLTFLSPTHPLANCLFWLLCNYAVISCIV